jgi:hypothetical protein
MLAAVLLPNIILRVFLAGGFAYYLIKMKREAIW